MEVERNPKRTGVKAILVTGDWPDTSLLEPPGTIRVLHDGDEIALACPGCGRVSAMRVGTTKPAQSPSWQITTGSLNDVASLTFLPSINCVGCCGWHGWLKNGVFESC